MTQTEELVQLSVRALAAQMSSAPGIELHMTRSCLLGLTEYPLADFNRLLVGEGAETEEFLVRAAARARERGRPLLATTSPAVAQSLSGVLHELGFERIGSAPLMVFGATQPIHSDQPMKIVRALDRPTARAAGDIIAAAFDEQRDVVTRYIEVCMTETSGVETYLGSGDEGPTCTVSVTLTGNVGAISLMATSPQHQRNGMGRTLLSRVISDYRHRGVQRFHLGATEAGRPLYASLGFEPVADLPVWLLDLPG